MDNMQQARRQSVHQQAQQQQQQQQRRYDGADGSPAYDTAHGGHYGAAAHITAQGHAPDPNVFSGHWSNVNQGLSGSYRDILNTYWQHQVAKLEHDQHDYKLHQLPLARIKKVMKADPEVKMISAEAPILFAKGCDIFITELTMRAWIHAEENKRRTLQRTDIASALTKSDMFDFLIDIVPREEAHAHKRQQPNPNVVQSSAAPVGGPAMQGGVAQHAMPPVPTDFMGSHMDQQEHFRQQAPGLYQAPGQGDPSMYGQSMYGVDPYSYNMPQQPQMYPVGGQRGPEPPVAGDANQYRPHDAEGEADAEGEREDYA